MTSNKIEKKANIIEEACSKMSGCEARRSEHRNVVAMPLEERSDDRNKADGRFCVATGQVQSKAHLLQLIGAPGSGIRRLALQFASPARSIIWISEKWNLYAPLLWKLAEERDIKLLGLECPERKRWRMLWRELLEAQVFDGWILDNLRLTPGETAFLQKLTRRFSIRVLALEERPRALFPNRAHIYLSHHSYRVQWMKGGPPTPQYFSSPFLEIFGHSARPRN